jgi:hypothetical protein
MSNNGDVRAKLSGPDLPALRVGDRGQRTTQPEECCVMRNYYVALTMRRGTAPSETSAW